MTAHSRGRAFIRYELPLWAGEQPPKPPEGQEEQGGKGKPRPRPLTTMAVGEESGTPSNYTSSSSTGENFAASHEAST